MNLEGTHRMKAKRERVWAFLNDPEVLRQCSPGCQQMIPAADNSYDVLMEIGIGAVKGRYTGKIQITDRIPGTQYKIAVTGNGSAGFLSAEGVIRLEEVGEETLIEYSGQAQVGGLIAGVGQRIMAGVAKQLVGQFFQCLEKALLQSQGRSGEGLGAGKEIS